MGMTMAEKILKRASDKQVAKPGDYVSVNVDLALLGDTFYKVYNILRKANITKIWDQSRVISLMDHGVPPPTIDIAENYKIIRQAVIEFGIKNHYGENTGICHQIVVEKGHIIPGMLVLGLDSHTTTAGAFGAAGTGIGITEMAFILKTGSIQLQIPKTIKLNLIGKLDYNVMSKDIILYIAGKYSSEIAQYKAIEFNGNIANEMSIDSRMTMSNMGVDIGAKFAFFEADEKTLKFLRKRTDQPIEKFKADSDATYEQIYDIELSNLEPQVAFPDKIDNVKPISEAVGIKIDQVFLGSCTNGRLEDLEVAASILKGRKIHPNVRMVIIPASKDIYLKALRRGFVDIFINCGALMCPPGCGPCGGTHLGVLGTGERCLGTHNRNFKGRMGSNEAEIYLCSPATAAASSIEGKIVDPRSY